MSSDSDYMMWRIKLNQQKIWVALFIRKLDPGERGRERGLSMCTDGIQLFNVAEFFYGSNKNIFSFS